MKIYYFGCGRDVGHYLWSAEWVDVPQSRGPFPPRLFNALDGVFCYGLDNPDGNVKCSYVPPFTICSWWDRSVDTRPGSNSSFIVEGRHEAKEAIELAAKVFPTVMARQKFPLRV